MSKEINDGGPAFPWQYTGFQGGPTQEVIEQGNGMTLRAWFAGRALATMNAAPDYSSGSCNSAIAERAVLIADAMIKALEGDK